MAHKLKPQRYCICGAAISPYSVRCVPCATVINRKRSKERSVIYAAQRKAEKLKEEELAKGACVPTDGIIWPATKGFKPCL